LPNPLRAAELEPELLYASLGSINLPMANELAYFWNTAPNNHIVPWDSFYISLSYFQAHYNTRLPAVMGVSFLIFKSSFQLTISGSPESICCFKYLHMN
jgi:hypothetical protein